MSAEPYLNEVLLIGRIENVPVFNQTGNRGAALSFRLITIDSWSDRTSGEVREDSESHCVVMYGRGAEPVSKLVREGLRVWVHGSLRTRRWMDKNNIRRVTQEIVANRVKPLDPEQGAIPAGSHIHSGVLPNESRPA